MGRIASRYHKQLVQAELIPHGTRKPQMTKMYGIEGPTENAYLHTNKIIQQICLFVNTKAKISQHKSMDELEKRYLLQKIYVRMFHKGRGAFAYFLDSIALFAVTGTLIYLAVRLRFANRTAALVLTFISLGFFAAVRHIVNGYKLERHIKRLRADCEQRLKARKLMLKFSEVVPHLTIKPDCHITYSAEIITCDEIIACIKQGKRRIIGIAQPSEKAKELMAAFEIKVLSPLEAQDSGIQIDALDVTEEEIDLELIKSNAAIKPMSFSSFIGSLRLLSAERAVRYFCTGAVLFLLSFIVRYGLYYRLVGMLCLAVSGAILGAEGIKSRFTQKAKRQ